MLFVYVPSDSPHIFQNLYVDQNIFNYSSRNKNNQTYALEKLCVIKSCKKIFRILKFLPKLVNLLRKA